MSRVVFDGRQRHRDALSGSATLRRWGDASFQARGEDFFAVTQFCFTALRAG